MQQIILKQKPLDYRSKEAYKSLRTNVEFSGSDIKVIAVTSCTPNEGKSSVSFRLASAFAYKGSKVLFIDADMRKSVLVGRHLKGRVRYGLVHYLVGQHSFDEVCCETSIENFHMIFSGPVPPNPSELLSSQKFKDLIAYARENYDIVIVDTPPIASVTDGVIAAKECDGALIVVSSGAVSYRLAQKIKEQIDKSGCKILGCVLNKIDYRKNGLKKKYYGKYYGSHYGG